MLELTPEQLEAVTAALHPTRPVISISGPAGVGKSTVLAEVARQNTTAAVLAPTNKAALVLREKGITRASTIHSILYSPAEVHRYKKDAEDKVINQQDTAGNVHRDSNGQPIPEILRTDITFDLRQDEPGSLPNTAYIDESSMLSETVLSDLHATFKNVVLLGDKFQLPPVKSKDVFTVHPPTYELRTILRQALDNPILAYATQLRQEPNLTPTFDDYYLRGSTFNNKHLFETIVDKECQAICFSNRLRHIVNDKIRAVKALPAHQLKAGEQLVALDNVRVTIDQRNTLKFYNGEILTLAEDSPPGGECKFYTPVNLTFTNGKNHRIWPFWVPGFWQEYESVAWKNNIYRMRQQGTLYGTPLLADSAYALTAHKAQGSEWPNVAVFHQSASLDRAFGGLMHRRWLYTAITRAKNRCLLVEC